jgi:hypothetical protein
MCCVRSITEVTEAGTVLDVASPKDRRNNGLCAMKHMYLAEARLCGGHGTLLLVSAGGAADHCRYHAQRGSPQDPLPSKTCGRPTPHRAGVYPPGSLRLVLRLTSPGVSRLRPRPLRGVGTTQPSSGPPPEVPPCTAGGWGGMAVLRHGTPARPAAAPVSHPAPCKRPARPHALTTYPQRSRVPERMHQSQSV